MARKLCTEWGVDEYVDYEEYAVYGVSGKEYERNSNHCDKLNIPYSQRCPLCGKRLRGNFKTLKAVTAANGVIRYYNNSNINGENIAVGNGCFKRLIQAYKSKYKK